MAYNTGPKIVTDGLVLCLDAADRNSYPGSGNTWYDLSGNGNDGTFGPGTAAPTFSGDNGGVLNFDGSDDIINGTLSSSIVQMTLCCFAKIVPENSAGMLGIGNENVYKEAWLELTAANNLKFGLYGNDNAAGWSHSYSVNNAWAFYCASINSSKLQKGYVNGELIGTYQGSQNYQGNTSYRISFGRYSFGQYVAGKIAISSIYNRELSADEIRQNYNATKGRFGL